MRCSILAAMEDALPTDRAFSIEKERGSLHVVPIVPHWHAAPAWGLPRSERPGSFECVS